MFGTTDMEINFGPQHPSTHGVLRIKLKLNGETIVDADPVLGYLHRGCEKLGENRTYPQVTVFTDRMDYIAAFNENQVYVEAVERLLGIEVPPRALYMRVILAEFQRLASHLVWLATHALDIGAMTVFLYCFREREDILELFEAYCGARLTMNAVRIGGMADEFPDGWMVEATRFLNEFPARLKEYDDLLKANRIWLGRTKDVGVIDGPTALDWGVTGPCLRGSGVNYDVRKAMPYAAYDEMEFDVPIGERGDTYDRYLCRLEEMRQSRRIIRQAIKNFPDGEIKAKVGRRIKPPAGEVYHVNEGPRGELGVHLISDGTDKPYRCRFRSPCFVNLQALPVMTKGHLVADVVAVIGTLDIVLGCVDR